MPRDDLARHHSAPSRDRSMTEEVSRRVRDVQGGRMPELVMSIDAGSTGITVLILDGSTRVVGRAYSEFSQHYPKPGWVEHDAEEIWEVTQRVAADALRSSGASAT